jgi:photosystem II stability/assembly factor-like uncharacterized protein
MSIFVVNLTKMKKVLFIASIVCCIVVQAQQWSTLNSGTTKKLNDVFFTSADTGYIVGNDSILLRTTDRGNTWTQAAPIPNAFPGNIAAVWMFDNGAGFATGEYQAAVPQTSNSGTSWFVINGASNPCFPDGLMFINQADGYLYGQGCFGGAYVSYWNGAAWGTDRMLSFEYLNNTTYVHVTGMAHNPISSRTIAVCNGGRIFSSVNNFQTWDTIPHSDSTDFSAVDYAGGNTFYAAATDINFNNVLISTDNGQTFTTDQTFPFSFYYPGFRDIDMLSNGFGVIGGYSQTTGGGILQVRNTTGWSQQIEATDQIINAVFVVDSTLAFAAGDSGSIYRYDYLTSLNPTPTVAEQLQLYPSMINSTDLVTINFPQAEVFQLDVIDARGRCCATVANCSGTMQFSSAQLGINSGMYLLRAADGQTVRISKILAY